MRPTDPIAYLTRLAELRAAQRTGILPQPGHISARQLATALGISRHEVDRHTRTALTKMAAGLAARSVTPATIRQLLTPPCDH